MHVPLFDFLARWVVFRFVPAMIIVCGLTNVPAQAEESTLDPELRKAERAAAVGGDLFEETPQQRDARMGWWRDARFGMFIHWGLYSKLAGEWQDKRIRGISSWIMRYGEIQVDEYEPLAQEFNPSKFDARAWVKLAKDAGMKYLVITAKHHDGFCLFDSKLTEYDIIDATPFQRDIIKELADECQRQGIVFCWYYSVMDWHHQHYLPRLPADQRACTGTNYRNYIKYMQGQLRELMTNYGDVGVAWFDPTTSGKWEHLWHAVQEHQSAAGDMIDPNPAVVTAILLRNLQPSLIINNRLGAAADFSTPERRIPATGLPDQDWETCMTMNDNWGYKHYDDNWKSKAALLRQYVDVVSKGGNYLLNIGPTAAGVIPQESVDRLEAIGAWMRVNGESIYGTTASVFPDLPWGRCTVKGNTLYLHIFDWPADGRLIVPGLVSSPEQAYLLADCGQQLNVTLHENSAVVAVPQHPIDPIISVLALEFNDEPKIK